MDLLFFPIAGLKLNLIGLENKKKKKKSKTFKALRLLGKIVLGIIILLFLIILFIRSPWGQGLIKDELVSYISGKTDTRVELDRLFITFSGDISMEGLFLEDEAGDTLVYSRELEADIPLWPIIRGRGISIDEVEWKGVRANIIRKDSVTGFNFDFLMDAFAPADTTTTQKDTTAGGQEFSMGEIKLADFDVVYDDGVTGIQSRYRIGSLDLEMEETDLETMRFHASSGAIRNSIIDYTQNPIPEKPEAEDVPMPVLILKDLQLENVRANYESVPENLLARLEIEEFYLDMPLANLSENIFEIERLDLSRSNIFLKTAASEETVGKETAEETSTGFEWPQINLVVGEINLEQNNLIYLVGDAQISKEEFNPEALEIQKLDLAGKDIRLKDGEAGARLENLSFTEISGINLERLKFDAGIDNSTLTVRSLLLDINENYLEGNLEVSYASIEQLLNTPENSIVDADIPSFIFSLQDIFLVQPELKQNEYLETLSRKPLYGNISANGTLSSLKIPQTKINWGQNTFLLASGSISNPTKPEELQFNFPTIRMESNRNDIARFVDEKEMGIRLPDRFTLIASLNGNPEDIKAVADLNSSAGSINLDGRFYSGERIAFNADLKVSNLELGSILQNEQLGSLNLTFSGSGEGKTINELDANIETTINSFHFNDYPIRDLKITGKITDGEGPVTMDYKDENLDLAMNSYVLLDSVAPRLNVNMEVGGANLQSLGLTPRDIRVAFALDGSFEGNAEKYDIKAGIIDGVAVYDDDSYLLGDFTMSAMVRPDSTAMDISNQIVDLSLRSNTDPVSFAGALQSHYESYLYEDVLPDTIKNPVNLELRAEIRQNPLLDEVFITRLEEIDTVEIAVDFKERERILKADVELPFINYMGNEIDSLSFHLDSDRDKFEFTFGFEALNAGPLAIKRTSLEGEVADTILNLDFNSYYEEEHLVHIQSELTRQGDTIVFSLDPAEVILNRTLWDVPETNQILIGEDFTHFRDFVLERTNQRMEITNDRPGMEKEHIAILFENFRLAGLLSYLNPETALATGRLNGDFTIEEPYGSTGLLAGLHIEEFHVMEVDMGRLTLDAEAEGGENYSFDLAVKEGNVDLDLTGGFYAREEGAEWDTELLLNRVNMEVAEAFSQGEITNGNGSFSGRISLGGTISDPEYEGNIKFDNAGFTVTMLNAPFVLPDEELRIDNEGVYLEDFVILDQDENRFRVSGSILTEELLNPEFDLQFEADDFTLLSSTSEDSDLYYGTAIFDVKGSLTGTMNIPVVEMDLEIGSGTNLTYVIPPSEVAIESRDGVVIFVNREDRDDILTQGTKEEAYTMTGMEIDVLVRIREGAVFNVIIDEQTGDNFQVKGAGDLRFNIFRNGRTTLSGRYEMSGGHYEMDLYGLVNRRFEIVEGSTITWAGDPFDANLDVQASYRVETSATDLMAVQTSGAEPSIRNRFRQELPFLVYLNVDGELMQPVLTFGLDMPEENQGAIGGQVYGRVQQLNQQEQELHKQVFSLLVLNRFYPESISDGSGGGTMAIARDNLNSALSDQLNVLSNNLLGDSGLAIDFGLDTYTDYQGDTPQERTQLDITAEQTFMDDRLVVRVGSEVDIQGSDSDPNAESPLIGNVSIEYLVTENGRWRLRGFRRNRFENVIEGQVIVSGIALIFTREFNEFRELWKSLSGGEEEGEDNNSSD